VGSFASSCCPNGFRGPRACWTGFLRRFTLRGLLARGAAGLKRVNDQSVSAQSAAYALMGLDCTADAARLRYNPGIHNQVDVGATN